MYQQIVFTVNKEENIENKDKLSILTDRRKL